MKKIILFIFISISAICSYSQDMKTMKDINAEYNPITKETLYFWKGKEDCGFRKETSYIGIYVIKDKLYSAAKQSTNKKIQFITIEDIARYKTDSYKDNYLSDGCIHSYILTETLEIINTFSGSFD
jgi:hypothetical protein